MAGMVVCLVWGILSLICAGQQCKNSTIYVPESVIQQLFGLVLDNQVRPEGSTFSNEAKIQNKGSYKCVMKFNRFGDSFQTAQRWAVNINDDNAFVPMSVTIVLLEAHRYGVAPRPSDEQLISTVDFCSGFLDTTKPYNNSLMFFWKCIFDETSQSCTTRPSAYIEMIELIETVKIDNRVTNHTENVNNLQAFVKTVNELFRIVTGVDNYGNEYFSMLRFFDNFKLSTDADVTSVWIILGSMLQMFDDEFLPVLTKWIQHNSNISSFFNAVKEFAYRPFSSDPIANIIDPQSYYVLRHFLDAAKPAGKDVALVSTWFTKAKIAQAKGSSLRSNMINNIDLTVCSNVINAITASILSGLVSLEVLHDPELLDIYQSTSELIAYLINSNFSNRPDLALLYYPTRYQFYWTVSRTVSIMNNYKRKLPLPLDVMETVFDNLRQALEGEATRFLISAVQQNDDDGSLYFDDFLGNGDVTDDNKPIIRGEDRIFTTAMAANVLMYTWLSSDSDSKLSQWRSDTPEIVKRIVDGCVLWLVNHALTGQFKPWNAFFTDDTKGRPNHSFHYPSNVIVELPQEYPSQYVSTMSTKGVQGYIPKNDYETMMSLNLYGNPNTTTFNGFNDHVFNKMIFWSSEPYTHAVTLLSLSKYRTITATDDDNCKN